MDLLGAPRSGHKQQDLENLTTAGHREDLRHPGADPFKVLRRLDDPYEGETAGGGGAIGVGSDNITNVGHLVSDTNTGCP